MRMNEAVERMAAALHELCQPLTALQCKLEMGLAQCESGQDAATVRAAMRDAELECSRMFGVVGKMRVSVRDARQALGDDAKGAA